MPAPAATVEPIRLGVRVPLPPEAAFRAFTDRFGTWWPREYTWSGDVLESIGMEPRPGGLLYEHGPLGFSSSWGRVTTWEPGSRLVVSWQIAPDRVPEPNPARASEVEIRFEPDDGGTRIELEHRGFERHGPGGAGYRDALAAEIGWPLILDRYATVAATLVGAELNPELQAGT
ncbi:MAG: SRPBCC family protein [Candidatus Limnocylindria bacterium]